MEQDNKSDIPLDEESVERVVQYLNGIFGSDIRNLSKAKDTLEKLKVSYQDLENQLHFGQTENPEEVLKVLRAGEDALGRANKVEDNVKRLTEKVNALTVGNEVFGLLDEVKPDIDKVEYSKKVTCYIEWVHSIQELSNQIETALNQDQVDKALMSFDELIKKTTIVMKSKCKNLTLYACNVVAHWHKNIHKFIESDFNSTLKALQWPFFSTVNNRLRSPPSAELIHRFHSCIKRLLRAQMPNEIRHFVDSENENESPETNKPRTQSFLLNFVVSSVPIHLLLRPFEVRFLYHFSGDKATNCQNNPEWYLTQVLKWISTHQSFISTYVQPVLSNNDGENKINAKFEFMKGLIRLVALKLSSDLPKMERDEDLFCLTVQETLNFERELRQGLGYPSSLPSVLGVLTQASVFTVWISLERKFSLELMDEFVSDSSAWNSDEEGGMCSCGQKLVLLLQGITDRYKPLSEPGHRMQFLDLQLELLDDFRVRLLQITKKELPNLLQSNYIRILNTVHHLVSLVSDWADLPFFIEMQFFREKFLATEVKMKRMQRDAISNDAIAEQNDNEKRVDSLFQNILRLYERIEANMLSELSHHVLTEVRAQSLAYRRDKWFASPFETGRTNFTFDIREVSPSLCLLLEVLLKHLLLLRKSLAPRLFPIVWKELAKSLDQFLYEDMILANRFSEFGSAQLRFDMTKALFPIFGEFTSKPDSFFPLVRESTVLLTLSRPTALLLRESLQHSQEHDHPFRHAASSPAKCLQEIGVFEMKTQEALVILNIRTNMGS